MRLYIWSLYLYPTPAIFKKNRNTWLEYVFFASYSPEFSQAIKQDNTILSWLPECQTFVDEFIRLEGRGWAADRLCDCGMAASFRCTDCLSVNLSCQECIVRQHVETPFHRIKEWRWDFFSSVTLESLGLRIQLGHDPGQHCRNPKSARNNDFVVIDTHRIHEIGLDFCGCETAASHYKQLLRARWFPATSTDPRTAATFSILNFFHLLSFESKVSAYEFYHTLARITDNTGIQPIRDRYSTFLKMVIMWRNIKMLMRAGRGHDPGGVEATQQGQLAVLCPACPQPGKNLSDNWENEPVAMRWLHSFFLAIDANFRLKCRMISTNLRDPGLTHGWAYFVEECGYKSYLKENSAVIQERSECVSHDAINLADTKSSKGLAATGVGAVDCARHKFKLPNGVGDLQKGEKYLNMDYLVFSSLTHFSTLSTINFSYDVACQWHKKLWTRVSSLPERLHFSHVDKIIRFFVPKFHLAAHIPACQTAFSFNWTPHVGRTDSEAPERGWANINRVASSTKEMGPRSRRDTLDDHFGDWNWKKVTVFGTCFKYHTAMESVASSELGQASLATWEEEITTWENDHTQRNPFESQSNEMTQAAVHLELAQQGIKDIEDGVSESLHVEVTPSILISTGIDLEHVQRRLHADIATLGQHSTDNQCTKILMRRNALQRRIDMWANIQALYMPTTPHLHSTGFITPSEDDDSGCPKSNPTSENAEYFPLLLPSEICEHSTCDPKLLDIEWSLCHAQANDALDECRSNIRLRHQLIQFKGQHIRGQGATTRARQTIQTVENRLILSHAKYTHAHWALTALSHRFSCPGWDINFQLLKKAHLRPMGDFGGQSQGTAIMSWIWQTRGIATGDNENLQECTSLHVECCKARACHHRWAEEIQLLLEEMCRVLAFLAWHAAWWETQGSLRTVDRPEDAEGLLAYAKRQAAICHGLHAKFAEKWKNVGDIVKAGMGDDTSPDQGPTLDAPPCDLDDVD
ncbi:uncharacterized protein F5147DRAFT_584181 [Suillus discolor]|uniref:CxC2-like cysteine cluster KDZ transposase-associated domain-containing protein n=1 Tax=Suillus discolor TaxID=1912936 RepID=A0A9P7EXH5_9AGAM|nr:uncharacterized protein F5147DRAFT_584181 [Suillus discolor]KAG2096118.1 hypothetical protein F5147DRAFT_584181 [Suillus discolor]